MALTKVTEGIRTLGTGEVIATNLATDSVTTVKILNDNITTAKILDNNVTIAKIAGSAAAGADTFLKKDGTWATAGGAATEMYAAASAPGSPIAGSLWFDTTSTKSKVYDGTDWLDMAAAFSATGGTETTYSGYKVHSFTSGGSFTVTGAAKSMDFMIVAGGGGGGSGQGGGGGGGGMRVFSGITIDTGTHVVTIGGGGLNGTNTRDSTNGGDSIFEVIGGSTYTSAGGGRGGSYDSHPGSNSGSAGGSGGGGGSGHVSPGSGGAGNTPSTSPSQGANGGGPASSGEMGAGGGGGGSSGAVGGVSTANGGDGTQNLFRTGSNVYYAGGGAGRGASARTGGQGGGGNSQASGTVNTGGGGGGGQNNTNSGSGATGIFVIRYAV